jgi:hypothetical protein
MGRRDGFAGVFSRLFPFVDDLEGASACAVRSRSVFIDISSCGARPMPSSKGCWKKEGRVLSDGFSA